MTFHTNRLDLQKMIHTPEHIIINRHAAFLHILVGITGLYIPQLLRKIREQENVKCFVDNMWKEVSDTTCFTTANIAIEMKWEADSKKLNLSHANQEVVHSALPTPRIYDLSDQALIDAQKALETEQKIRLTELRKELQQVTTR